MFAREDLHFAREDGDVERVRQSGERLEERNEWEE